MKILAQKLYILIIVYLTSIIIHIDKKSHIYFIQQVYDQLKKILSFQQAEKVLF